ncbi:MAG: hypothetical protein J1E36_08975 [Eubacterium sp.]|nr:hypothetical protein [Eubacterium sp.]
MINDKVVYIATKDFFEAGLFEGALKENEIPYEKRIDGCSAFFTALGGPAAESYSFYVLERDVERCNDILEILFGTDNEDN